MQREIIKMNGILHTPFLGCIWLYLSAILPANGIRLFLVPTLFCKLFCEETKLFSYVYFVIEEMRQKDWNWLIINVFIGEVENELLLLHQPSANINKTPRTMCESRELIRKEKNSSRKHKQDENKIFIVL